MPRVITYQYPPTFCLFSVALYGSGTKKMQPACLSLCFHKQISVRRTLTPTSPYTAVSGFKTYSCLSSVPPANGACHLRSPSDSLFFRKSETTYNILTPIERSHLNLLRMILSNSQTLRRMQAKIVHCVVQQQRLFALCWRWATTFHYALCTAMAACCLVNSVNT